MWFVGDVLVLAKIHGFGITFAIRRMIAQRLHVHLGTLFDHDLVVVIHDLRVFGQFGTNALELVQASVRTIFATELPLEGIVPFVWWRNCAQDVLVSERRRLPAVACTYCAQAPLFAAMVSCVGAKTGWEL
jgi:hypothetical protein